jgi:hypothetical protein
MKTVLVNKAGTNDRTPVQCATQAQIDSLINAHGEANVEVLDGGEVESHAQSKSKAKAKAKEEEAQAEAEADVARDASLTQAQQDAQADMEAESDRQLHRDLGGRDG